MDKTNELTILYDRFESSINPTYENKNPSFKDNKIWKEIQLLGAAKKESISLIAFKLMTTPESRDIKFNVIRRKVFKASFNKNTKPSKEGIKEVFSRIPNAPSMYEIPVNDILFCFSFYSSEYGKDRHYLHSRNELVNRWNQDKHPEPKFKQLIQGITKLDDNTETSSIYEHRDVLGQFLTERWSSYGDNFKVVIEHCWSQPQKSKPTKTWEKETKKLILETPNTEAHIDEIICLFDFLIKQGNEQVKWVNAAPISAIPEGQLSNPDCEAIKANAEFINNIHKYYLLDENEVGVSYLIWYATYFNNKRLNTTIGNLATTSFKKVRWIGSLSTKNGNACLYGFTLMPEKVGITNLLNIRNKTLNKNIKKLVDGHIKRKAKELNLTEESLLELSAPTFDLQETKLYVNFDTYLGVIEIKSLKKIDSYWINEETKKGFLRNGNLVVLQISQY